MKADVSCSSAKSCSEPAAFSKAALPAGPSSMKQPPTAGRASDQAKGTGSLPLPFPWGSACSQMNSFCFGRSFMPMMPFGPFMMPGTGNLSTAGNSSSKGTCKHKQIPMLPPMMPTLPPYFPHPAQLQAMSAAAQAAMAQMKATGMPFPPFMMPPAMVPMQPPPVQQGQYTAQHAGSTVVQTSTDPATPVAERAAVEDDEDTTACADEDVEVDPETEMLFEKVAAMERQKATAAMQAPRAESPCLSIHSACTGLTSSSPSHSPVPTGVTGSASSAAISAAVFEEAASLHSAPAIAPFDDAPVPWLAFAADDGTDDIDKDLAQLISLPPAAAAICAVSPQKAGNQSMQETAAPSMHEVAARGFVLATASGATGGATAPPAGQTVPSKPKGKLIRIKTTKTPAGASVTANNSSNGKSAKAAKGLNSKSCSKGSRQKPRAEANGLGLSKAGVQKKCSANAISKNSAVKLAASLIDTTASVEDPSLSILCDPNSGLNETCFGQCDDVGIDSLAVLEDLLEEASDADAWDSLVAGAADMELCSALQV